jgi:hypothetical protein
MVKWFMASVKLTPEQIKAILRMSENQLFRVKVIDSKIPGYKANPGQLKAAESAIQKLESAIKEDRLRTPTAWETPTRRNGIQRVK